MSGGELEDKLEDISEDMLDLTELHTVSHSERLEMAEETSDRWRMEPWEAEELFTEVGALICEDRDDGDLFIPEDVEGSSTSVYIPRDGCEERGGRRVGSFHTHPTPPITPSQPDLRHAVDEDDEITCIGTVEVNDPVVACMVDREGGPFQGKGHELRELREVSSSFTGEEGTRGPLGETAGEINLWVSREPGAREILEEFPENIEYAAENSEWSEEELREELEQGNVPPPLHAPSSLPDEKVDLEVATRESEREAVEGQIRSLRRDFDVEVFRR